MTMNRRDALKTLGTLGGVAAASRVMPACGDGADGPVGIQNVVYVMMENRSYDHQLGARKLLGKGGNGLVATMSNPDVNDVQVPVFEAPDISSATLCVPDPPHGWERSHEAFSNGTMQGFLKAHQEEHNDPTFRHVMQYLTAKHAPVLWSLADSYTTCDAWFCSVMGPTWPNRMFWHAATSNGVTSNVVPDLPFDQTIFHRLNAKSVDWHYYYSDLPFIALLSSDVTGGHVGSIEDFINDARDGKLKPFTYVEPSFALNDDHPPHHPLMAQQFISMVYTALRTSPQWNNTMLLITYDEHGGFFEHVPPPTTVDQRTADGFNQLGFRVPTYVVGPYAKQDYVSSTPYEHCSALHHLINRFGLDPINDRTTAANDYFDDTIDQVALTAGTPRAAAEIPAVEFAESDLGPECMGSTSRFTDDIYRLADENPKMFAGLDRRKHAIDDIYLIGDYLEMHNAGRIVRGK